MWNYIRKKLGIVRINMQMMLLSSQIRELKQFHANNKQDIALHNMALARIIIKLDPLYAVDERDPNRKAASDEIGRQVLEKLKGEYRSMNEL